MFDELNAYVDQQLAADKAKNKPAAPPAKKGGFVGGINTAVDQALAKKETKSSGAKPKGGFVGGINTAVDQALGGASSTPSQGAGLPETMIPASQSFMKNTKKIWIVLGTLAAIGIVAYVFSGKKKK